MTTEMELIGTYMEAAPEPDAEVLAEARRRLAGAMAVKSIGDVSVTNVIEHRSDAQPGRRYGALVGVAAAVVALAALSVPLLTAHGSHPTSATGTGRHGAQSAHWRLASSVASTAWQVQPSTSADPYLLTCPTATTCYASGQAASPGPSSSSAPAVVEVSGDGGQTWHQSALPVGAAFLSALTCPAASTCMIAGVTSTLNVVMYSTTDGGQSWSTGSIPGRAVRKTLLSCSSPSDCVVLDGRIDPSGTGGEANAAYRSVDGGQHWSATTLPATFLASTLQCQDASCVATGQSPPADATTAGQFKGTASAIYSTDGGQTWSVGAVPAQGDVTGSLSCIDAQHCMAIEQNDVTDPIHSIVITTIDGGQTWTASSSATPAADALVSISCDSVTSCTVTGEALAPDATETSGNAGGVILATDDGGQTWTSGTLPTVGAATVQFVGALACPGSDGCVALAWAATDPSAAGQGVVLSNQSGVASGSGGTPTTNQG